MGFNDLIFLNVENKIPLEKLHFEILQTLTFLRKQEL